MPRNQCYKWAEDAEKNGGKAFQGSGRAEVEAGSVAALQREDALLKEENGIEKKRRRTSRGSCRLRPLGCCRVSARRWPSLRRIVRDSCALTHMEVHAKDKIAIVLPCTSARFKGQRTGAFHG